MKANMDIIQFESRREIEKIVVVLNAWMDEHKEAPERDIVQEMIDKLEVMHMNW